MLGIVLRRQKMSGSRRRTGHPTGCLRQVIAEGSEEHVVNGCRVSARWVGCFGAFAGPGLLGQVRVLQAKLQAALRSVVGLIPEPQRAFPDVLGIAVTIRQAAGIEARSQTRAGQRLNAATGVVKAQRAISDRSALGVQEGECGRHIRHRHCRTNPTSESDTPELTGPGSY